MHQQLDRNKSSLDNKKKKTREKKKKKKTSYLEQFPSVWNASGLEPNFMNFIFSL